MKIAFKGFNCNLECRGTKFEIGVTYSTQHKGVPTLCTNEGFHYCEKIEDIASFYSSPVDRICLIEVLGPFSSDSTKSITTSFRIIQDITSIKRDVGNAALLKREQEENYEAKKHARDLKEREIKYKIEEEKKNATLKAKLREEILKEERQKAIDEEKVIAKNLNLGQVRKLQEKYPLLHIGGSVGLFLHGIILKRMKTVSQHDLDLIAPYFTLYSDVEGMTFKHNDPKASGNDFDQTFTMTTDEGTVKVDVRIDPKQAYEIIKYDGFDYKVSKLEVIWEAKIKYTAYNNTKHKKDLYEAMGTDKWQKELSIRNKIESPKTESPVNDSPW